MEKSNVINTSFSTIVRDALGQSTNSYKNSSESMVRDKDNLNRSLSLQYSSSSAKYPFNKPHNTTKKSSRPYYSLNNICNNCGKSGHLFHQCKMPIMSIGIILFRIVPQKNTISSDTSESCNIRSQPKILHPEKFVSLPPGFSLDAESVESNKGNYRKIEYLIIRRKETLGYIDFMRGKYSIQNKDYIMNMLKQMTNDEKQLLRCKDFDFLWKKIWGPTANNSQYKSEEINSREKYHILLNGVKLNNDYYTLDDLIDASYEYELWEEPEWGFPKGRRNNQENDFDCAVREFCEETGYNSDKLVYFQNVIPYEEIFTGSNYKSYKHKYFLMNMDYEDSLNIGQYQTSEVSMIAWKTLDECVQYFRPYNLEKIRILKKVDEGLKQH